MRRHARAPLIAAIVGIGVAGAAPAHGDKWSSPEPKVIVSANGAWSAYLTPAPPNGNAATVVVAASPHPEYGAGWNRQLVNANAPVRAFVSDHAELVTLGDWHREGYAHAVVIYDARGHLIADRRLEDFLTRAELAQTTASVSSRWWRYNGERPELDDNGFSLTTAWGTTLHFDLATGNVSRDAGRFPRFVRYCEGTRPAPDIVIRLSRAWRVGKDFAGRHCELLRSGARCQNGNVRLSPHLATTDVHYEPRRFDELVRGAPTATRYVTADGSTTFDPSYIHVEMLFGDTSRTDERGPLDVDHYSIKFQPASATPEAREWSQRLEALVGWP